MKRAFLLNVNSNFSLNVHLFHSTVKTWAERAWKKNEIQRSLAKKNRENSNFGIYLFIYLFIGIYRSLIYLLILIWNKRLRQAAQTHLNKLLTLQKRALRLMHFADNREHAIPIFIATNIMPINMLYYAAIASLAFDLKFYRSRFDPAREPTLFSFVVLFFGTL